MAQLNFPSNPTIGQRFTIGTNTWEWTGTAWIRFVPPKNIVDTFTVTDTLYITSTTNSFSTLTGALIVSGGVGIGLNLFVGSSGTFGGDLIPAQNGIQNLGSPTARWNTLYVTSSTIDIGGAILSSSDGVIQTENLKVTGSDGSISTNSGAFQVVGGVGIGENLYIGGQGYINGAEIVTTSTIEQFSPKTIITAGTDTAVNTSTGNITIWNISTLQSITSRGSSTDQAILLTNTTDSTSTTTGALIVTGGVAVQKNLNVAGRVSADYVTIADAVIESNKISVNTTDTTTVDSYSISDYRSTEYLIQIGSGIGTSATFQVSKILMIVSNTSTVFATEYGIINTAGPSASLGSWSADVTGGTTVNLYFTPSQVSDKTITVVRTGITA